MRRETDRQRKTETERNRHRHRNRDRESQRVVGGWGWRAVGRDQRLGGCSADADRHAWRGLV